MPYQFTSSEQAQIQAARLLCPAGENTATSTGNWVPFYTTLSSILAQRIGDGSATGNDLQDMRNAKLWLDVAMGANGGTGMHSAFIRTYTDRQGVLRRGSAFSTPEMQKASNGIALRLWNQLTNPPPDELPWSVPSISTIARADATAIGQYLFGSLSSQPLPDLNDTAITANAAWSGTLGFNLLGGVSPFESWRLLTAGDGTPLAASTANKLDDFKNLLFAVDSYQAGLKAGYLQGGQEFLVYLATAILSRGTSVLATTIPSLVAQLNISFSSGNFLGLVKDLASRTPAISAGVNIIAEIGSNKFLDMLMGATVGANKIGLTTDANFASRARDFFSGYGSTLQNINAQLLPTSASAIVSLARTDVNARAALVAGSIVKVQVSVATANSSELSLYDPATGQGQLSDKWLEDRSMFVLAIGTGKSDAAGQVWRSSNLPTAKSFEFRYVDANGVEQIILAENTARAGGVLAPVPSQLVYFGGSGAETLSGSENKLADHLYGGAGDDILDGKGGGDYLEGGSGIDTYSFSNSFGNDTIVDSDGKGKLTLGGTNLIGGKYQGAASAWVQKINGDTILYKLIDSSASSTGKVLVISKQGDNTNSITINHFNLTKAADTDPGNTGYLGIKLDSTRKLAITEGNPGTNFWSDSAATLASLVGKASTFVEGTARAFTIALNMGAKAGDSITLAMGGAGDKFKAILGDTTVPAHGAVITLTEGQTEVRISLVETEALTADASATLSATYKSWDPADTQTIASNSWGIAVQDAGEATNTLTGDTGAISPVYGISSKRFPCYFNARPQRGRHTPCQTTPMGRTPRLRRSILLNKTQSLSIA